MAVSVCARDLRTLVTVERVTETTDGLGDVTRTWAADPAGGVWAKVTPLGGGERWQAARTTPGAQYKVLTRFVDDGSGGPYWTHSDRATVYGREYSIAAVVDVDGMRRWVEMILADGVAS